MREVIRPILKRFVIGQKEGKRIDVMEITLGVVFAHGIVRETKSGNPCASTGYFAAVMYKIDTPGVRIFPGV